MSVSERIIFIIVVTVVVPRVCVCVPSLFVVFCHHVYLDPDVRVHRCTENSYNTRNRSLSNIGRASETALFAVRVLP